MAQQYQRSTDMPIGAVLLKFMERYIYDYPQEWYQWKKYTTLDMFEVPGIKTNNEIPLPVLEPSFS
jgi:hypothetical protein